MTIDKDGFCIDTLDNIMNLMEEQLQSKFGNDFAIKAEGVIDNIALSSCYMNRAIQEQIAYLLKQFDPETAEGKWQDALYERIGAYRLPPQKTIFNCDVAGTPSLVCPAGTITIRSKTDNNEFENVSEVTITEDGSALAVFQCVAEGPVEVNDTDEFAIITAPQGITSVVCAEDIKLSIGRDEESDKEFRIRFRNSKALNAKATHNACIANLSKYVDDTKFLRIVDKKVDDSFEPGNVKIIAYHNTTDNIFASAILDTVAIGIQLNIIQAV